MNKLAVISGGSKGIGKAIVYKFASHGFDIVTCSRKIENIKPVMDVLKTKFPTGNFIGIQADISKKEDVKRLVEEVSKTGRPADVLINNTGLFIPGQIQNEEEGVMEYLMATNVYSAYHLTRGLLTKMIEAGKGHIFNICSTASITPYKNGGSYCISKYALLGMTKVLREELKQSEIKVTAVLPGATLTTSWEGINLPEERFMKAEDVADVIWSAYNLSKSAVVEEILLRPQLGDIS
ncbi:MAG: SDR family oxidoreductase [Cytophagaceae bacterium]